MLPIKTTLALAEKSCWRVRESLHCRRLQVRASQNLMSKKATIEPLYAWRSRVARLGQRSDLGVKIRHELGDFVGCIRAETSGVESSRPSLCQVQGGEKRHSRDPSSTSTALSTFVGPVPIIGERSAPQALKAADTNATYCESLEPQPAKLTACRASSFPPMASGTEWQARLLN